MTRKRRSGGHGGGGGGGLERLPDSIIYEILERADLETLCSAACVSDTIRSSVYRVLSSLPTLDLSSFSPDVETLDCILNRFGGGLRSLTVDCLRLHDSSFVTNLLGEQIQELNLFKGSFLSHEVLASIGRTCPNLRVLVLELAGGDSPEMFKRNLTHMLNSCSWLESLCIKIRGTELDANGFQSMKLSLPKTVKVLKLQPLLIQDAIHFIRELRDDNIFLQNSTRLSIPVCPVSPGFALQSLSLVLDIISDELVISITKSLPFLVELDLEDRPIEQPQLPYDLTNSGLQTLGTCQHLTGLSLVRNRQNHPVSFKAVNDMGMFLLSVCCRGLQSVTFGGFSKISDAGFAAILQSCNDLKKFEVRNGSLLSDLAIHDMKEAPCSLVDVKLWSCSLITSESIDELASSNDLEVALMLLMLVWPGRGNSPITRLCLRSCKRITDRGIYLLLNGGGTINKTLSALDVGYLPGISDEAIFTIAMVARSVTELCIRYCFFVTDASLKALASGRRLEDGEKLIRRLDLFRCHGLSVKALGLLKKPLFRGLQWLGVGDTHLTSKGENLLTQICKERPWLTVCRDGCEMGCHDGWQFHKFDCR
ncbi:hypothetical protein TEA_027067 [Camellia sinensis var. sinensis]|uniref:F-box domain-containing protein n=1 Tax=Camellia sinensis var. sinensis TaxID=542762 RepID=A0A4S4D6N3_CAMSN|nr:hypothetical protein TEA_027067 [Camellia sinensis var. sinensis]